MEKFIQSAKCMAITNKKSTIITFTIITFITKIKMQHDFTTETAVESHILIIAYKFRTIVDESSFSGAFGT
jgi:hypothetical protein